MSQKVHRGLSLLMLRARNEFFLEGDFGVGLRDRHLLLADCEVTFGELALQLPFLLATLETGLRGVDLCVGFGIADRNRRPSFECCEPPNQQYPSLSSPYSRA